MLDHPFDCIELKGLRMEAIVGVLEKERSNLQPIELDITIFADLRKACDSDQLTDTIDYGEICLLIEDVVAKHHDFLLERLAGRIADRILTEPKIKEVLISVKKLNPPVPSDLKTCGITIKRQMHDVIVSLGSNLGNRSEYLRYALNHLGDISLQSQVFETEPVGCSGEQSLFLNMVASIRTPLTPYALLQKCQNIEALAGREKKEHWGARTLDIDILFYDDIFINSPILIIPHPLIYERGFVLAPLAEIAPEKMSLDWKNTVNISGIRAIGKLDEIL